MVAWLDREAAALEHEIFIKRGLSISVLFAQDELRIIRAIAARLRNTGEGR